RLLGIVEPGREPAGHTPQMRQGSVVHRLLESAASPTAATLAAAGLSDLTALYESPEWRKLTSASPERELPFMMHLSVNGKEWLMRGRMDVAVATDSETGMPRVIDYKYAVWREAREDDYEIQMTSYALALMKSLGTDRALAELWYLKSPMKIMRRQYERPEA